MASVPKNHVPKRHLYKNYIMMKMDKLTEPLSIDMISYLELLYKSNGETEEECLTLAGIGNKIAESLLYKVSNNLPLSHALIIEAEKNKDGSGLHAKSTDINRAIVSTLGISVDLLDIEYESEFDIPAIGKVAKITHQLWKPSLEMTSEENVGMARKLRARDQEGNVVKLDASICWIPTFALRAVILGYEPEYMQNL